jgi:hypothetical protein
MKMARTNIESGGCSLFFYRAGEKCGLESASELEKEWALQAVETGQVLQGLKSVCANSVLEGHGFSRAVNDIAIPGFHGKPGQVSR